MVEIFWCSRCVSSVKPVLGTSDPFYWFYTAIWLSSMCDWRPNYGHILWSCSKKKKGFRVELDGMVAQQVVQPFHSSRVSDLTQRMGYCLEVSHVLFVFVWVACCFFGFFPPFRNMPLDGMATPNCT